MLRASRTEVLGLGCWWIADGPLRAISFFPPWELTSGDSSGPPPTPLSLQVPPAQGSRGVGEAGAMATLYFSFSLAQWLSYSLIGVDLENVHQFPAQEYSLVGLSSMAIIYVCVLSFCDSHQFIIGEGLAHLGYPPCPFSSFWCRQIRFYSFNLCSNEHCTVNSSHVKTLLGTVPQEL
jgi:hypothetical protein